MKLSRKTWIIDVIVDVIIAIIIDVIIGLLTWRGFTWKREDKDKNLFARGKENLTVFSMFPK